jgi:hypothetical protein
MQRLVVGLVFLGALALAAQDMPGVRAGNPAHHSGREISLRRSKHSRP